MDFLSEHLLSLILFVPVLAALVLLFAPPKRVSLVRWGDVDR